MILNKITRLLFLTVIIVMISCSKEPVLPELDYSKVYLIKREYFTAPGIHPRERNTYILDYLYDSTGRINRMTETYPIGSDTFVYIYNDSTSVIVMGSGMWHPKDTVFIQLNNKGLMISEYDITNHFYTRYEYNADENCVKQNYYGYVPDTNALPEPKKINYYQYDGGNLVKEFTSDGKIIDYLYYNDKVNTVGNINFGMPFKGKSSKNLMQKKDSKDSFDGLNRLKMRSSGELVYEYQYY